MRSIKTTLLLAVNLPLMVGFAGLLTLDYQREVHDGLSTKQTALAEEAKILLPSVLALEHHGGQEVQRLVDDACRRMSEEESPGHHIAIRLGDRVYQAHSHGRGSEAMVAAMDRAADSESHTSQMGERSIVVGMENEQDATVYVSEFTDVIMREARQRLVKRFLSISAIGVLIAVLINYFLVRLVTRPAASLSQTVHRIAGGEVGLTAEQYGTREFSAVSSELSAMSTALAKADRQRQAQLALARRIQQKLLPDISSLDLIDVNYVHRQAEEVGGDFFDILPMGEGRFLMCLADTTGHGIPAAMSAAMLKVLIQTAAKSGETPERMLTRINRGFYEVTPDEVFATMALCVIDTSRQGLFYTSAGHESSYLLKPDGGMTVLESTGILLGVDQSANWSVSRYPFAPGDQLMLVTDGVTEAMSREGSLYGREALRQTALRSCGITGSGLVNAIMADVQTHLDGEVLTDDLTLVVVGIKPSKQATAERAPSHRPTEQPHGH